MLSKVLLFLFSFMSNPQQSLMMDSESKIVTLIKTTLRAEVIFIGFKLLLGLILSSVTIFSLIQVGQALQVYLNLFENGNSLIMVCFASIAILSLVLFYLLFKKDLKPIETEKVHHPESSNHSTIGQIGSRFIQGLVQGFANR